jgi:hypothetical protein
MKNFQMKNDLFIQDIAEGHGSLNYYNYFVNGLKIQSKTDVYKAIQLKCSIIIRQGKGIYNNGKTEKFNYKTLKFEEVK